MKPNDPYRGRTAPLTFKRCILYIYSTNIGNEYFKHGIYSPFFPLQNAVRFIILTYLVPVFYTFYIRNVLKLKTNYSDAKRLNVKVKRHIDCFKSKTKVNDSTKHTTILYVQNTWSTCMFKIHDHPIYSKYTITLYVQNKRSSCMFKIHDHSVCSKWALSYRTSSLFGAEKSCPIHIMWSGGFDVCESKSGVKVTGYN